MPYVLVNNIGPQRLEPRHYSYGIEEGLQAKVVDPLFMMGRQWQVGEFRATNGGSLVRSEVEFASCPVDKINMPGDSAKDIDIDEPLEKIVEEENIKNESVNGRNIKKPDAKFWNSEKLEYSFGIKHSDTELVAQEYFGQTLDWYSFNAVSKGIVSENITNVAIKPTEVSFHGMPLKRFYSFEDQKIDLGDVNRPYLNYLLEMLVEFSFIYSHNWYLLPLRQKVGHIRKIRQLKLIDSFGVVSEAEPVVDTSDDKQGWEVFTIAPMMGSSEKTDGKHFYFPNNLFHDIESKPVEEVIITRDELANLVWAIENRYESYNADVSLEDDVPLRELLKNATVINRRDETDENEGIIRAKERQKPDLYWEREIIPDPETGSETYDPDRGKLVTDYSGENEPGKRYDGPVSFYHPKSYMPPHWIPYVAKQLSDLQQISLRRGRTRSDKSIKQYKGIFISESRYIHEEEIPRTGIVLTRTVQLARDRLGRRHIWWGRKKKPGEHIKSSGLKFDYLKER